jgi:hypothetical protein
MKNNRIKTFGLIMLAGVALLLYSGCASSIDRGSLSDAIDKANDNNKGDRRVTGSGDRNNGDTSSCLSSCLFGFDDNDYNEVASMPAPVEGAPPATIDTTPPFTLPGRNYFGIRAVTSNRFSRNYTNSAGAGLLWVNHYKKRRAIETSVQCEVITTDEKSKLFGSVNGIIDLETGIHGRRYSTPDFTFMGLYLKYGGDLNFLFWDYRNPVESVLKDKQGNIIEIDTIRNDGLFGIDADIGLGWSFVQMKRMKVSLELLVGGTVFWFQTFESFKNDRFYPDGYIKAGVEVLFGNGRTVDNKAAKRP